MGRLADFRGYLQERIALVGGVEAHLCALQSKYETFYGEVSRVRESELEQLTAHIVTDRERLPPWLTGSLDRARSAVEEELVAKLNALREEEAELARQAEAIRQSSAEQEAALRRRNVELDAEEERLKARSTTLLAGIAEHNARIRELGRGFGFFANLLRMRRLSRDRLRLDAEQADLAARLEGLRARWANAEQEHAAAETRRQQEWVEIRSRADALRAKLEYLEASRPTLLRRSTVERVLFELARETAPVTPGDPPCPRCQAPNPAANHFCHICARRLADDRPDLAGSIEEIAELNAHHGRFSDGMRACQEIIGLVRGLRSGLLAFSRSVEEVMDTEGKYPLPKLQIEVPAAARDYGRSLDQLGEVVRSDLSLHPQVFAAEVAGLIGEVFTEPRIKRYFETMGEELSRQASSQW